MTFLMLSLPKNTDEVYLRKSLERTGGAGGLSIEGV
mgnify:CR=1 FL=1